MFNLIERPHHFPGRTLLGDTRGPVIDTGVDHNGWVYLNEIEGKAIGALWEMVEREVHELAVAQLEERIADLEADVAELTERMTEKVQVVAVADLEALLAPKPKKAAA